MDDSKLFDDGEELTGFLEIPPEQLAAKEQEPDDLFDEPVGLISTGLGGEGEWLRYIFVLALQEECPAQEQQQEIEAVLGRVCQQNHSKVEQIQFCPSYLSVRLLVPLDEAVGEVIEAGIARLNQHDDRVRQEYLVTNVAVPTEEEIESFLMSCKKK